MTHMRLIRLIFIGSMALWAGAGCGARRGADTPMMGQELGPGPLVTVTPASVDFFAEHRVEIHWGDKKRAFRAVLQQRGDLLELILLGPMEQPVVRIFQQGTEVGEERFIQGPLPFEPEYILADVQKAFLRWSEDDTTQDGALEGARDGLRWREEREGGRVQRRIFERDDLPETLPLIVHYTYEGEDRMPSAVHLENTWFDYTLDIQTLRWSSLE